MVTRLHEFLGTQDHARFLQVVRETARDFQDVIGVLAVGTLVQTATPVDFYIPRYNTARGLAYERIRNPGRRRLAIREESDLDIWVCTRDTNLSSAAQEAVELGAVALLSELVSGTLTRGSTQWHNKKRAVFGRYYKNPEMYSREFTATNGGAEPWMAHGFKASLEARIIDRLPYIAEKVNERFSGKIPGEFLEVRAFPESLFHLRPDDTMMPNMQEDRMPFPRVANNQWIGPEHSSLVMYASEDVTIYPFKTDGRVLGSRIAAYLAVEDAPVTGKSYGGLVIKPDAIKKKQLDVILTKIYTAVANFNGRIVAKKKLSVVTDSDVEKMYPLLKGRDLQEAKEYLVGGEMIILIVESDHAASELFRWINEIKGPRLIDRSYERLMEGRILDGSIRDLLPIPGEEDSYKTILSTILAKQADPDIRFSEEQYRYYAQNLAHSPDNEVELQALLDLVGFTPK